MARLVNDKDFLEDSGHRRCRVRSDGHRAALDRVLGTQGRSVAHRAGADTVPASYYLCQEPRRGLAVTVHAAR